MKWFSHESMANRDTKLKKLLMKYGAEGYGLYWYCVEHVCANVDPKLTFELEHDSEILAHELKVDTLLVEEMMRYMVSVGLFEESNGIVTCLKLAKHLGENCTRNPDLKTLIKASKKADLSQTVSDNIRLSENVSAIRDNKRREDKKNTTPIPKDFGISDGVRLWAEKSGHRRLNAHLENFVDAAKAKNYRYADWDAAFKTAIRKNWAGIQ